MDCDHYDVECDDPDCTCSCENCPADDVGYDDDDEPPYGAMLIALRV